MSLSSTSAGAQIKEVNSTKFLGWDPFSLVHLQVWETEIGNNG